VPDVRHEIILGIEFWIGMGIVPNLRHLTWEFADSQADVTLLPPLINHLMTKDDLTAVQKSDLESSVKEYFNRTKNTLGLYKHCATQNYVDRGCETGAGSKLPRQPLHPESHRQRGR
jgi:hypothetical protein